MQKILLKFTVASLAVLACAAANAQAKTDDLTTPEETTSKSSIASAGFFSQGAVNDFSKDLSETGRKDFEYYLPDQKKLSLTEDEKLEPKVVHANSADAPAPKDPKDLISMYGDPNAEAPVKAIDSAPAPYKGLLAAIEQGRDDLALQYARQWVMYNKKLDKVTKLAVGMAGVVQEKEGMIPAGSFPASVKGSISPEALKAYDANMERMSPDGSLEVNAKAKALLDEVSRALNEDSSSNQSVSPRQDPNLNELKEAKRVRFAAHLAETYLYVPQGQLDILVFFRPQDTAAQKLGRDFEKLYQLTREFQNTQFKAFSPNLVNLRDAEQFKRASGATFPLVQGESLVSELKLTAFPVIVFVARQSGEALIEKEFCEYEFVEQTLRKFGVIG